jgi:membrane protein implicated in regulation of membrane protease activity
MNWQNIFLLASGFSLLCLILIRSVRRIRLWIFILVGLPTLVLILRWASFRSAWLDLVISFVVAVAFILLWWRLYGRHLPPPHESQIKVWTEDDPF